MKTLDRKNMPAVKITIQVDERTGKAYQDATPERQRRAQEHAERSIQRILMTREEAVAEFDRITEKSSAYAKKTGWTEEDTEALLRGDYDND